MSSSPAGFLPLDRSAHRLLIVDDDTASRYATQRRLSSAGFRTAEAASGAAALAMADESFSAFVLDVHLPDLDGFELARQLRARPSIGRVPILHLSASYLSDDDKVRGLDAGADAYLTHPVEPAVLVATVQALVRTRMAETAMRRSEEKFRAIFHNAPNGICLLDAEGRFLELNPAMQALMKRPPQEIVGQPLARFVPPPLAPQALEIVRAALDGRRGHELPVLDAAGVPMPLEWHVSMHSDGVWLAQVTDISGRKLREQLEQVSLERERDARANAEHLGRMKDGFIAVLSHELRSPLNAIMGWTHVLLRRGGNEQTMQGLAAIQRNGQAQARLISDLLDMSSLDVGKMRLARAPVDPLEVVQSAVTSLESAARDNENRIVVHAGPAPVRILGDAVRLQQVVWNLLSNAVKFSPHGGRIDVVVAEAGDGVLISVRDHGRGIAPEFLPRVFDRFAQGETSDRRYRSGLGLGLSIVQQLVQAHGGHVAAASPGPGKGATFDVWLPVSTPAGQPSDAATAEAEAADNVLAAPLQGLRVLVVEDDMEALTMLQAILAERGAVIASARHADEALALLPGFRPDLLLSDVGLPGKDGHDLVAEVRRRERAGGGARLPAIALTAFAQAQDRRSAIAAGFDLHCSKPVRPLQLVRAIGELCRRTAAEPGGG